MYSLCGYAKQGAIYQTISSTLPPPPHCQVMKMESKHSRTLSDRMTIGSFAWPFLFLSLSFSSQTLAFMSSTPPSFLAKVALEYVNSFKHYTKWHRSSKNLCVGDIVVLCEDNTIPMKWLLAKLIKVYPGIDGLVRVVSVKMSSLPTSAQSLKY